VTGSVSRGYDSFFRPSSDAVAGGSSVSYGYDSDGLLTSAGDLAVTNDPTNGLVTGTSLGSVSTSTAYDAFGELASTTATANSSQLFGETFTRDNLGRITSKQEAIGGATHTYSYTYDPQTGRLTQVQKDGVTVESYSYDIDGNRTSGTVKGVTAAAAYDAQGELTQYGITTYTDDVAGNRASKTDANGTTSYSYDPLGSLRSVTLPNSSTITYLVDGQGQRIGKEVNGTLVAGYLYDQDGRIVALLDGTNAIRSQFVYAGGASTPSYLITGNTEYRILSDQTGSPRLVVNAATGQAEEEIDYDSFGNATVTKNDTSWDTTLMPFGFGGGLVDTDTGLVHLGARDYDPQTGTWTSRDPLGFGGGDTGLYSYVHDDPVNLVDTSGLGPNADDSQLSDTSPNPFIETLKAMAFQPTEVDKILAANPNGFGVPGDFGLNEGSSGGGPPSEGQMNLAVNGFTLNRSTPSSTVASTGVTGTLSLNASDLPRDVINRLNNGVPLETLTATLPNGVTIQLQNASFEMIHVTDSNVVVSVHATGSPTISAPDLCGVGGCS
jgi:RHS repeat-associated protein